MKLFNKYKIKKPRVDAPNFSSVVKKVMKNANPKKLKGKKSSKRKAKRSINMGK